MAENVEYKFQVVGRELSIFRTEWADAGPDAVGELVSEECLSKIVIGIDDDPETVMQAEIARVMKEQGD